MPVVFVVRQCQLRRRRPGELYPIKCQPSPTTTPPRRERDPPERPLKKFSRFFTPRLRSTYLTEAPADPPSARPPTSPLHFQWSNSPTHLASTRNSLPSRTRKGPLNFSSATPGSTTFRRSESGSWTALTLSTSSTNSSLAPSRRERGSANFPHTARCAEQDHP